MNFQQPEKTHHCHWKKKQLWKYEMKMIWKKNHHHSTIQPFFDTTKKMNNNEKKWIVIQFGLKYLKRTSLCTWKVHIPFLKYNSPKHCPISRKKCLFCIKNKKVVKQLLAKMILKKSHFGFPPISILTYPFSLQCRCALFCLIFFILSSVKIDILLTFVSKLPIS